MPPRPVVWLHKERPQPRQLPWLLDRRLSPHRLHSFHLHPFQLNRCLQPVVKTIRRHSMLYGLPLTVVESTLLFPPMMYTLPAEIHKETKLTTNNGLGERGILRQYL